MTRITLLTTKPRKQLNQHVTNTATYETVRYTLRQILWASGYAVKPMLRVEIVALPAGGRNVTQNTHQASVLLEPLTHRRAVISALLFLVA